MSLNLSCPECGAQFDLGQAMEDADARRLLEWVTRIPPVAVRPYFRYLRLFKPAKQSLRWSRMLTLTREIAPMIEAAQIERNHASYVVPPQQWADAMTELAERPPASLKLPLKSHGYLLSILATQAEKSASQSEQKREEKRRFVGREGVHSGPESADAMFQKHMAEIEAQQAKNREKSNG